MGLLEVAADAGVRAAAPKTPVTSELDRTSAAVRFRMGFSFSGWTSDCAPHL